ncbi:hypothetical protein EPN18_02765 [bacterium]|nr:MAG: hypothetical protein EPN18_02765 [bacterium]
MLIEGLKQLIDKAIEAGITVPNTQPFVPEYSADGTHTGNIFLPGTASEQTLLTFGTSTQKQIEKELLEFISSNPLLAIFNNNILFNFGSMWKAVPQEQLLRWVLYTASKQGSEKTIKKLNDFLSMDYTPATEVLAVSGIEVEDEISLPEGCRLLPFSQLPLSLSKDLLDPPNLKLERFNQLTGVSNHVLQRFHKPPTAAIIRKIQLTPKYIKNEEFPLTNYQGEQTKIDLFELCECLTIIGKCAAQPVGHWHDMEGWVPIQWLTGGCYFPPLDNINSIMYKIPATQTSEVSSLCRDFFNLKSDVREKLRVPIQRLNQSRRRQNLADKAIDVGVSFESLFLGDRLYNEQISFTFRLRGAWFLGRDKQERLNLINIFNKMYECRSISVHTGKLDATIKVKGRVQIETKKFLEEADALCVSSIKKIIHSGKFPNWDEIILGNSQ